MMLHSKSQIRDQIAIVVPVHFGTEVSSAQIRRILEATFQDTEAYCRSANLLAVVDRDSVAEQVLKTPGLKSNLAGIGVHTLKKNRAKAGAIASGLRRLLEQTESRVEYFITRDCDGDHFLDDVSRLVNLAINLRTQTDRELVCAMGSRVSLAKPMGWVREEWEQLTNKVLLDMMRFVLSSRGEVMDERFWNGSPPDIQSGYRVYNRKGATLAVECLDALPEDRTIITFACEFLPFFEIGIRGGVIGQVNRLTLVEQPVSSYSRVDYARAYGQFLGYAANRYGISDMALLKMFDNHLWETALFFTDHRRDILGCREQLCQDVPPVLGNSCV